MIRRHLTAVAVGGRERAHRFPLDRGVAPSDAAVLTAFIDVQKNIFYYLVAAWADGFTGSVIGAWQVKFSQT